MKNIHILPTDKPSRIYMNLGQLFLEQEYSTSKGESLNYNIYITSDEEIKFNDYITDGYKVWQWKDNSSLLGRKKIILTTDADLIKNGVQAIDDEFLEWFFKNRNYEWVEVEIESKFDRVDGHYHDVWEIIIPKEETLEEAKKYAELSYYGDEVDAFVRGAKWQAKRMYSEEEVKYMLQSYAEWSIDGDCTYYEWFEQFKKK